MHVYTGVTHTLMLPASVLQEAQRQGRFGTQAHPAPPILASECQGEPALPSEKRETADSRPGVLGPLSLERPVVPESKQVLGGAGRGRGWGGGRV